MVFSGSPCSSLHKVTLQFTRVLQDITDTMVTISFSKNDGPVVEAYKLESHLLGLDSLYPHISTKNFSMAVNFGQLVGLSVLIVLVNLILVM